MTDLVPHEPLPSRGDLTRGPLWRKCLRYGMPLALGMMGPGLFHVVDLVIVGRVGEGAIASVTISGIVLTVIMLMFDGVSNITVALTAQGHSAGRRNAVHDGAWESFWLAVWAGLGSGLIFYLLAEPTVALFDFEHDNTVEAGIDYLEVMSLGNITMFQ